MTDCRVLYLDLMKKCLTDYIYADVQERPTLASKHITAGSIVGHTTPGIPDHEYSVYCESCRVNGMDVPAYAHTMIGMFRLNNIQHCVEQVIVNKIPGDLMECGVWRGGACIFMRAILEAYGVKDKRVWIADSFEGLPLPDCENYPKDIGDKFNKESLMAVSLERVKQNFDRYWLLDEQDVFLKGWFKDTLPNAPIEKLAVLRLDGDMYESTMEGLVNLYPKLSVGGYLIVDDYGHLPACKSAVEDYRNKHGITEQIINIDWCGVYWRKLDEI
jgi:hypothetical protein